MFSTIERQLFEQNLAAQLVVDPRDGAIVSANRAAADLYGLAAAVLEARSIADLSALPAEDTLQLLEIAAAVGAHAYAIPHHHAAGELRLVEIHAGPFTSDDATLVHLIVHDVTERVRAEESAREMHAERVAARRTAELQEALRRRETLSRMGELVAGVAHEVRTPLFAISSTLDALRARIGEQPELTRHFHHLTAQVERLGALMHDLLEYGKPSSLELAETRVDSLLAGAVELTRAMADAHDVSVTTSVETEGAPLVVDRRRLLQVLQNLVANAVQHSSRGATVHIEARSVRLHDEEACELRVLDEGPGFSLEALHKLFEPFYSRRPGGTGLGLAIAHRFVHDHGGSIEAMNRAAGGAELVVRLPVAGPQPSADTPSPPGSTPRIGHDA